MMPDVDLTLSRRCYSMYWLVLPLARSCSIAALLSGFVFGVCRFYGDIFSNCNVKIFAFCWLLSVLQCIWPRHHHISNHATETHKIFSHKMRINALCKQPEWQLCVANRLFRLYRMVFADNSNLILLSVIGNK